MSLAQIKILHRRPGESIKERTKLAKNLTIDERVVAVMDAQANGKCVAPFGGRS